MRATLSPITNAMRRITMMRRYETFRPTRVGGPLPARVEAPSIGRTQGHSEDDDIHPWRVVGVGDAWEVHDVRGNQYARGEIDVAHAEARALKLLHPEGFVPSEQLVSGPAETVPERLAGCTFWLQFHGSGGVYHFRALTRQDVPGWVRVVSEDAPVEALNVSWLQAVGGHVELFLALAPFYWQRKGEIEP